MKRIELTIGDNLEVSKKISAGRIETMIGKVLKNGNTYLKLKLFKRTILNISNSSFDLVEITSAKVPILWKSVAKVVQLEHSPNIAVVGIDDSGY